MRPQREGRLHHSGYSVQRGRRHGVVLRVGAGFAAPVLGRAGCLQSSGARDGNGFQRRVEDPQRAQGGDACGGEYAGYREGGGRRADPGFVSVVCVRARPSFVEAGRRAI